MIAVLVTAEIMHRQQQTGNVLGRITEVFIGVKLAMLFG